MRISVYQPLRISVYQPRGTSIPPFEVAWAPSRAIVFVQSTSHREFLEETIMGGFATIEEAKKFAEAYVQMING